MSRGKMIRTVTVTECPWLSNDVQIGSVVFKFYGATYGCISHTGIAVSNTVDKGPFFEVPRDSVEFE